MDTKQQMIACRELLEKQGLDDAAVDYFEAYAEELMARSLGLFSQNYAKLLALAKDAGNKADDSKSMIEFGLKCKMDVSNLNIVTIVVDIGYGVRVSERSATTKEIHPQPQLPLEEAGDEPDEPSVEPSEAESLPSDEELAPPEAPPAIEPEPAVAAAKAPAGDDEAW